MAIEKVGIYRKYHGNVPKDKNGKPLPKELWPKKRSFSWSVRWFSSDGKRYSKSFKTRKEAENYAETKQLDVRSGKPDLPKKITLKYFYDEHKELMEKNLAKSTLRLHLEVMSNLADRVGWNCDLKRVKPTDIERVRALRLKSGIAQATSNKEFRAMKRVFNLAISRGYLHEGHNPCQSIKQIKIGLDLYKLASEIVIKLGLYSQRADITFLRCARAHAAFRDALNVEKQDLERAALLVFEHRLKRIREDISAQFLGNTFEEIFGKIKEATENPQMFEPAKDEKGTILKHSPEIKEKYFFFQMPT